MKKTVLFLAIFLVFTSFAYAAIDISPAKLDFNGVLAGKEYTKNIRLISDSDSDISVSASVSSNLEGSVKITPSKTLLNRNFPVNLKVSVNSETEKKGTISLCFTSTVMGAISPEGAKCSELEISVTPGSSEDIRLRVGSVIVHPAEADQPFDVEINLENMGNVDLNPLLMVGDKSYGFSSKALNTETLHIPVNNPYPEGEYVLPVKIILNNLGIFSQNLKFIVSRHIQHKLSFSIQPTAYEESDRLNTLLAAVTNTGETGVNANIKLSITKDSSPVKSFDYPLFIGVGETKEIPFEYLLGKGIYKVHGQVFYSGTYTDIVEQELVIADHSGPTGLAAGSSAVILLILVLFIYAQRKQACSGKSISKTAKKGKKR